MSETGNAPHRRFLHAVFICPVPRLVLYLSSDYSAIHPWTIHSVTALSVALSCLRQYLIALLPAPSIVVHLYVGRPRGLSMLVLFGFYLGFLLRQAATEHENYQGNIVHNHLLEARAWVWRYHALLRNTGRRDRHGEPSRHGLYVSGNATGWTPGAGGKILAFDAETGVAGVNCRFALVDSTNFGPQGAFRQNAREFRKSSGPPHGVDFHGTIIQVTGVAFHSKLFRYVLSEIPVSDALHAPSHFVQPGNGDHSL